jgi:hypothetical protein
MLVNTSTAFKEEEEIYNIFFLKDPLFDIIDF